jgi:hypothetical protein
MGLRSLQTRRVTTRGALNDRRGGELTGVRVKYLVSIIM